MTEGWTFINALKFIQGPLLWTLCFSFSHSAKEGSSILFTKLHWTNLYSSGHNAHSSPEPTGNYKTSTLQFGVVLLTLLIFKMLSCRLKESLNAVVGLDLDDGCICVVCSVQFTITLIYGVLFALFFALGQKTDFFFVRRDLMVTCI